eukprot:GGOE01023087.1.p1 GENE.GGOE01023087.1~~GGOE01023087.1.p1  ORF type:complete len:429 (+),score=53.59 GGOE01023087.1:479-1765(+)
MKVLRCVAALFGWQEGRKCCSERNETVGCGPPFKEVCLQDDLKYAWSSLRKGYVTPQLVSGGRPYRRGRQLPKDGLGDFVSLAVTLHQLYIPGLTDEDAEALIHYMLLRSSTPSDGPRRSFPAFVSMAQDFAEVWGGPTDPGELRHFLFAWLRPLLHPRAAQQWRARLRAARQCAGAVDGAAAALVAAAVALVTAVAVALAAAVAADMSASLGHRCSATPDDRHRHSQMAVHCGSVAHAVTSTKPTSRMAGGPLQRRTRPNCKSTSRGLPAARAPAELVLCGGAVRGADRSVFAAVLRNLVARQRADVATEANHVAVPSSPRSVTGGIAVLQSDGFGPHGSASWIRRLCAPTPAAERGRQGPLFDAIHSEVVIEPDRDLLVEVPVFGQAVGNPFRATMGEMSVAQQQMSVALGFLTPASLHPNSVLLA